MSTYLYGTSYAQDSSSRLLLGPPQIFDGQLLAWLRSLAGVSPVPGLPNPIDTEAGGALLDKYLTIPSFQMRTTKKPLLIALLAVLAILAVPAGAQALTVYAAASLRDAFPKIDGAPTYSFLGSNQLQAQIERGAPADVFASASPNEARRAVPRGPVHAPGDVRDERRRAHHAEGQPEPGPLGLQPADGLAAPSVGTAGVPIGAYTRQILARLRLTSILRSNRVSLDPNVAAITSKVALGSADAGFVYVTDAQVGRRPHRVIALPKWSQPPVRYQMCVVRRAGVDTAGARTRSSPRSASTNGRRILRSYGFGLPPRS